MVILSTSTHLPVMEALPAQVWETSSPRGWGGGPEAYAIPGGGLSASVPGVC